MFNIEPEIWMILGIVLGSILITFVLDNINTSPKEKISKNEKQLKNVNKKAFYKEIPCFGDINIAYWLLYNYSNEDKQRLNNGLFGAYILKWYKKGYIDIKKSKNIISKGYDIYLNDGNWEKNYVENVIYKFLKEAAGNNNILEKNEIRNYCSVNTYKPDFLVKEILEKTSKELEEKKYITIENSKTFMLFKAKNTVILSEKLIEEYENLIGLKNFLQASYNIEEKEDINFHLREDYLIFASLLGIADKVKKQFNKIEQDFNEMDNIFDEPLGDSWLGLFESTHKRFKMQWFYIPVIIMIIALIMIFSKKFSALPIGILIVLGFWCSVIVFFYQNFREIYINRKVNEMNSKTYAKITNVKVDYDERWDCETNTTYTKSVFYWIYYEYYVDNIKYDGCGRFKTKKRKGSKIKIYYNEMKPDRSETAKDHNSKLILLIFILIILVIPMFF